MAVFLITPTDMIISNPDGEAAICGRESKIGHALVVHTLRVTILSIVSKIESNQS